MKTGLVSYAVNTYLLKVGLNEYCEIMMMKYNKITPLKLLAFVLASVIALFAVNESRASSWKVHLSLKRDTIEDAMIMPSAVFIDEAGGKYYVVDSGKNRLLSFDREGNLLHVFTAGDTLKTPFDMVRTQDGLIWVVEKGKNSLTKIDLKAQETIPKTLTSNGRTIFPHRIETDGKLLYIQDKSSGDILVFDSNLNEKQRIECAACSQGFFDFKVKGSTIWALDRLGKSVYSYSSSGAQNSVFSLAEELTYPSSIAVGPSGYIYILDRHSRDISVYSSSGDFKYRFLKPGIASGQLYYPVEIKFDPWDGLCVTDEGNARVEVYKR